MATSFPSNPTNNQTFQPEGSSTQYIWTGTYWAVQNNTRPLFNPALSGSITTIDSEGYVVATTTVLSNGVLIGTASFANSSSFAASASFARSSSFTATASFAQTASSVDTLNQEVVYITNKLRQGLALEPAGQDSVAFGVNTNVSGSYAMAVGSNNFVSASATATLVAGQYNSASAPFQTVVGQFNAVSTASNDLFVIGNGDELGRRNLAVFNRNVITISGSVVITGSLQATASAANTITLTTGSGLWVWSMGNPTTHGWTLAGTATYSNTPAGGIVLTTDTGMQTGIAYRSLTAAYFTNNDFIMTINAKASGSTGTTQGGDGVAMYMGAANNIGGAYDGLTIYLDEYHTANATTDALKINVNNSQFAAVDLASFTGFLDINRWRKLTAVVTGVSPNRTLTVLIDDIIVWRGAITWTPTGGNYGVWGFTGGARNHHAVNMVNLHPAKMWLMSNGLL